MDRGTLAHAWDADKAEFSDEPSSLDPLLPPLHRLLASSADGEASAAHAFSHETITVSARLDRQNPLTEARWVKTGEVDNWIVSLGIAAGASPKDASKLSEWRSKIKIVDPDPVRGSSSRKSALPSASDDHAHESTTVRTAPYDPACARLVGVELERRHTRRAQGVCQDAHVRSRQRCVRSALLL